MLVSHSHKFIYIKTRKTASTTIERYLTPYCENGIIQLKEAHTSAQEIKVKVGQEVWDTYEKICVIRNPWDKMVSWYYWRRRRRFLNKVRHFFKFKSSKYNLAHDLNFTEYIKSEELYNLDKDILNDEEWIDFNIIRYEFLLEDLEKTCKLIGIPFIESKIGSYKSGHRPKKSYKSFYDEETEKLVAYTFSDVIEKMGYEF